MALIHRITAALVILLGIVHVAMAPVFFDEFTMRVMWYVAQGLLAIVIGFLNLAVARTAWRDSTTARLCHLANGLGVVYVGLYAIVDRAVPSYVAIIMFVFLFFSAMFVDLQKVRA